MFQASAKGAVIGNGGSVVTGGTVKLQGKGGVNMTSSTVTSPGLVIVSAKRHVALLGTSVGAAGIKARAGAELQVNGATLNATLQVTLNSARQVLGVNGSINAAKTRVKARDKVDMTGTFFGLPTTVKCTATQVIGCP